MTAAAPDPLDEVRRIVERDVRPAVRAHHGDVTVSRVDADGIAHVDFHGACTCCPYRKYTLLGAISPRLRDVPGVHGVAADGVHVTRRDEARIGAYYGGMPA